MESSLCVIVAADEMKPGDSDEPTQLVQALTELARMGCRVWWTASPGGWQQAVLERPDLAAWVREGRIQAVPSLEDARRQCGPTGGPVLVVGLRPAGSIRWANRHRFTSALVVGPEDAGLPAEMDEVPDFVLDSFAELPRLVFRMEREAADFEGTE